MTAAHVLPLLIMLVLPVFTALIGLKRMTGSSAPGAKSGYRSERSMVSADAWAFAQKTNGLYNLVGGIAMIICSVLLTLVLPVTKTMLPMIIYALVFVGAWIVMNLVLMVLTETAIMSKHFDK